MSFGTKWLASGILLAVILSIVGCGGSPRKAVKKPDTLAKAKDPRADLPGKIVGSGWRIRWRERDADHPKGEKAVRVLDADAQEGEMEAQEDKDTILLRDVKAKLYREGKPSALVRAPEITANQRDRVLNGSGGVRVTSLDDPPDTVLTADTMRWDTHSSRIVAIGNARVVRQRKDGGQDYMTGDRITFDTALKTFENQ